MKTIWDRLKPEYKQRILKHQEKYHSAPQRLEESLKSIMFWGEMSVEDLRDFFTWTDQCLTEIDWEDTFGDRFINK
tara:strand:- start:26 stop:253 length:228 start_codon:yes stop_codon:yes gene_type:complete